MRIKAQAELELRKRRAERLMNYKNQIDYYSTHPLDYIVERLGVRRETIDWCSIPAYKEHRWDGTENPFVKILNCLVDKKWVGVESATSTGKTFLGACLVLWFLECYENSLVVTTAPKKDQLTLHLWRELGRLYSRFNRGELQTLKLKMNPDREDWLAVGFVAGVKADEDSSTKAQGFHAQHMLIIFEETPGIPPPIITAFQNTSTSPHNLILAFGNPDHQLDNLHKFCKLPNVEHIRISGFDHPNVVLNDSSFVPGAQSVAGLEKMLQRYGDKLNPLYLSRARGISPSQSEDSLIRLEWCYACANKRKIYEDEQGQINYNKIEGKKYLGVDVANSEGGDKAAITKGKGNFIKSVIDFQCPDSNALGRQIYQIMKDEDIDAPCVGIDGVGVGAGTVNTLKELGEGVINIQGAEKPVEQGTEEEFNNLRSQMFWLLREDIRNGELILPYDEDLFADLTTPKWFTRNGKIVVESKEDIKKRLGHSPNKGDSVAYYNFTRRLYGHKTVIKTSKKRISRNLLAGY